MKQPSNITRFLVALPLLAGSVTADPPPQSQISFTAGASETWNADWLGVPHRIYTIQWSLDLVTWHYAPFIDFGDGIHSRGMSSSTDKFFIRLHYLDAPEIDTLEEAKATSFDGQGLPLEWKILNGLHPFNGSGDHGPNGDLDGDGVPNSQDSRPNDDSHGIMTVTITSPANGTSIN